MSPPELATAAAEDRADPAVLHAKSNRVEAGAEDLADPAVRGDSKCSWSASPASEERISLLCEYFPNLRRIRVELTFVKLPSEFAMDGHIENPSSEVSGMLGTISKDTLDGGLDNI